ncbi:hypothetical protein ACTFIV_005655 [Dictyostelium citrinum]
MKILFLYILILGVIKLSNSYSCNVDIGGYSFDLTPLKKNDGYHKIISDYGDILYFNFCNSTIDTPCGNSALAYLFDGSNGECHSLGVQEFYSINAVDEKKTLLVNFRGGDIAYDSMVKMFELFVIFSCDENDDTTEPTLINTMEYGYASVIWPTKYSCPIKIPTVEKIMLNKYQHLKNNDNNNNNYNNNHYNFNELDFENKEIDNDILNQYDHAAQSNAFEISNKNIQSPNEVLYNEIGQTRSNLNKNKEINNGLPFLNKLNQMSQTINNNRIENEKQQILNKDYEQKEQQQQQLQLLEQQQDIEENENNNKIENVQFINDIKPIDLEQQPFNDDALINQLNDDIELEKDQTNFDTVNDDEIANQIMDFINDEKIINLDGDYIKEDKMTPNFIIEDIKPKDLTDYLEIENGF